LRWVLTENISPLEVVEPYAGVLGPDDRNPVAPGRA